MLTYIEGDLFSSPAQVLVNTVNTVGVMGKGIALDFKKRYPNMFDSYKKLCDRHALLVGKLMLWYAPDHWLLLFPTKEHWRNPSKLEYIEKGLMTFVRKYADYNITSIAFPKLGCGNGELSWNDVKRLMEKYLSDLPIETYIYLGKGKEAIPKHKRQSEMVEWMKENSRDLSFAGMWDALSGNSLCVPETMSVGGMDWIVSWKPNSVLSFESDERTVEYDEAKIHEAWDDICEKKVFSEGSGDACLLYYYLSEQGFLQQIRIQDDNNEMIEGYQLDAGKGRAFLVRGVNV